MEIFNCHVSKYIYIYIYIFDKCAINNTAILHDGKNQKMQIG